MGWFLGYFPFGAFSFVLARKESRFVTRLLGDHFLEGMALDCGSRLEKGKWYS